MKDRKVILGVRWPAECWDKAPAWIDALMPKIEHIPLVWSFTCPPEGSRKWGAVSFDSIKHRLGSDALAPIGFSGALHPLLSVDELEKELSWTFRNPWSTGITELFGATQATLAPRMADLARTAVLKAYRGEGVTCLALESSGARAWRKPTAVEGVKVLPYVAIGHADADPVHTRRRLRAHSFAGNAAFIMVDLSTFPSLEEISSFFSRLSSVAAEENISFCSLESRADFATPDEQASFVSAGTAAAWRFIPARSLRSGISASAAYRTRRRKKNEDYRRILDLLSFSTAVEQEEEPPDENLPAERNLTAHMQGEVALAGSDFDVRISGGKFCGISRRGAFLLPNVPAASHVVAGGKTFPFKSMGSLSFDEDGGTGLRDESVLEVRGKEATAKALLTIDYEFRGSCPELLISVMLRLPQWPPDARLEHTTPLSLFLCRLGRSSPAEIEVGCPDGSAGTYRVVESDGWVPIPGSTWSVGGGGARAILRAGATEEGKWGLTLFRVVRKKGQRLVEADPFGGWISTSSQLPHVEKHSLLVGVQQA